MNDDLKGGDYVLPKNPEEESKKGCRKGTLNKQVPFYDH